MTTQAITANGIVALMGLPNVGKSTLLNYLAQKKIVIATHKAQTTRRAIYHPIRFGDASIVFADTPGLFAPKMSRAFYQEAWGSAQTADLLLFICDGRKHVANPKVLEQLKRWEKPIAIAINKIDAATEEAVFAQTAEWQALLAHAQIFQISAKRGTGIEYLKQSLLAQLNHRRTIHIEQLTLEYQASEITREKILLHIHQELPWQAEVETIAFEKQKKALRITQTITVPVERQKSIFIGQGGSKLKAIGQAARQEMQTHFDKKVHLFIDVRAQHGVA